MLFTQLNDKWWGRVQQIWPEQWKAHKRMLTTMMIGLHASGSVQLSEIASHIPSDAKETSIVRRIERFLDNSRIRVREWYRPLIVPVIEQIARQQGEIRLIIDGSKVGQSHQLLMVAIGYRSRAIPVGWTWVRSRKGHSSTYKQMALLDHIRSLLPADVPVLLVGDTEFGNVKLLDLLDQWKWSYVLRQKGSNLVQTDQQADWIPFGDSVTKPGETAWHSQTKLTQKYAYSTNLLAYWAHGEDEPWLLATNLPTQREALRAYRRRPWIECLFGDLKGKGFDLEASRLRHFLRLSRLTLVVAIVYIWCIFTGAAVIKNGNRTFVDRNDRRDLSIFQIGIRWIRRCLKNQQPFKIKLTPT